jgi:hypothetical protein
MYMGKNIEGYYPAMVAFASVFHTIRQAAHGMAWLTLLKTGKISKNNREPIAWPD